MTPFDYTPCFSTGDWHTHSLYSDGRSTPEEMVKGAIDAGLALIAITDHVTKKSDWLDEYIKEISHLKEKYKSKIFVLCGVEAKVVDTAGNIDVRHEYLDRVDLTIGAFHRFPKDEGFFTKEDIENDRIAVLHYWHRAMRSLLQNKTVHMIAHPANLLRLNHIALPAEMREDLGKAGIDSGKLFEVNIRYRVPDIPLMEVLSARGIPMVIGSDSHSVSELLASHKSKDSIPQVNMLKK